MLRHHVAIHPPAVGKTHQRAKANPVDPRPAKPVRRLQPPEEILLVALQVMAGIGCLMIGFLIDHHPV